MEKKKCKFCGKRYVKQKEWKTEEENELCLKCYSWYKYIRDIKEGMNNQLKYHLGIKDKEIRISIVDKKGITSEMKCLFCKHYLKSKIV